ncbi:hypothetical protein JKF63_00047 [Porcisia hertigi]|uniref:PPM-type phosphatase domain-containing protein n=1 Tax=Porcisia hertigi TaxID=2761500 RepID=A0A836HSX2_9TRYP|nr:hypothetical protein JKF63_00047 [Porcisia hertigi]
MGDMLAKPETQKFSTVFETSHLRVGCCSMQGWRKSMEDAHVAQLNLNGKKDQAFFGVFDGHQSDEASRYCRAHMLDELLKNIALYKDDVAKAFEVSFQEVDNQICKKFVSSGTTANCVYLADQQIVCANAGDSRAVLYRGGKVIPLSVDHKPSVPSEEARILAAGCQVENGRVNMTLAVSRALGDVDFKSCAGKKWTDQAVTASPDITVTPSQSDDEFIVMGCDGIWDVLSNEECCNLVKTLIQNNEIDKNGNPVVVDISLVCEQVLDRCLAHSNSEKAGTDNMTIIVVEFKPPFFKR